MSPAGIDCPEPFEAIFRGAEGSYQLSYRRDADSGVIETKIAGVEMTWPVDFIAKNADGEWELGGLTRGAETIWKDVYWFELRTSPDAPLNFWGDQVLLISHARD